MLFEAILFLNFNFDSFYFFLPSFNFNFIDSMKFDINFFYLNNFFILENFEQLDLNFENAKNIYHYSIPVTKLYYPEPFVAMPSFLHYDPWFFHILIYQYWLWFLFIFLVIFFFIIFICTLRWTNPRIKPRRETRGVSRSKCGDLITATVPTTWAGSIIIHESTDAIDFYDGFGTSELVIGIRAFQWGWEYYYPKDIDLNYNIDLNHSFYFGNSLKYFSTSDKSSLNNKYWRFYQLKTSDQITNPLTLMLLNNNNFLNLTNQSSADIGLNLLNEVNSFKKIYYSSSVFNKSNLSSFFNQNLGVFTSQNFELDNVNNLVVEKPTSLLSLRNNFFSLISFVDFKSVSFLLDLNENLFNNSKLNGVRIPYFFNNSLLKTRIFKPFNTNGMLTQGYLLSKGHPDSEFLKKEALGRENLEKNLGFNFNLKSSLGYTSLISFGNFEKIHLDFFFNENLIPLKSTNPFFDLKIYDINTVPFRFETPILVSADDDSITNSFTSNFFNTSFPFLNEIYGFKLNKFFNLNFFKTYVPGFVLYADYDFRRWQNSDLIEDALFDSCGLNNSFFDFFFYKTKATDYSFLLKSYIFDLKKYIYSERKEIKKRFFKYDVVEKPFKKTKVLNKPYQSFITLDNYLLNSTSLIKKDFFYISKNSDFNFFLDESFSFFKSLKFFFNTFSINSFLTNQSLKTFNFSLESLNIFKSTAETPRFQQNNFGFQNSFYNFDYFDYFNNYHMGIKFNYNYSLLYSYKNVANTYDAMQKIFRTKLTEMRSHFKNYTISDTDQKTPFISSKKFNHRNFSGKTLNGYLKTLPLKYKYNVLSNKNVFILNQNNTYFFDFPFLTSVKSDAARYIWSDWFARWNFVETQASSLAKYGMYGMPHFSKIFDFGSNDSSNFKDSEQYASRLFQSRKNFSSSWLFTPYFYLKSNIWYKDNVSIEDYNNVYRNLFLIKHLYNKKGTILNFSSKFSSGLSGSKSPARSYTTNIDLYSSYNFLTTKLTDILTKREYLFFQLNTQKLNNPLISKFYINSPNNTIYQSLRSSFNQVLYDYYDSDTGRFVYQKHFNLNKINNLWSLNKFLYNEILSESPLKTQFRSMKKGIANMVKIHANGAISLPIETRLQVLASSRDVIHSWAVPSAGIKIDCVPGYSSHRVMIFLLSGIYWGQCMEICGRYHHWMPIIVYFMKRDLFLLWCTHFVFFRENTDNLFLLDNFYFDHLKTISFDKTSWLIN